MKVALRYSGVEDTEVAILRGIHECLLRLKQKTKTTVPNETTERRGGRRFISHIVTCANTSLIGEVVDQGINNLRRDWLGSIFILLNTRSPKISRQVKMAGVALRSAYGWIGFSAESDLVITDSQGIDCMEKLEVITDGEIDNLCNVIRRPGGINHITNIANLGLQVSLRSENNLKLTSFFLKHKIRTGRVAVATNIRFG